MNQQVKEDILSVLTLGRAVLERQDSAGLKELSNNTIHNASIFQDSDSVSIAVIFYSLSKIMERGRLDVKPFVKLIVDASAELNKNNFEGYEAVIKKTFEAISKTDQKLGLYISKVIEQAQIKKGSKLYDHGISLAQSASVLGISQWELMSYVGKTSIADSVGRVDVRKRLDYARRMF